MQRTYSRTKYALALVFSLSLIALPLFPPGHTAQATSSGPVRAGQSERAQPEAKDVAAAKAEAQEAYGKVGMSFEANQGQTDETVNFLARGAGYTLFLTPTEAVFVLARRDEAQMQSGGNMKTPSGRDLNSPPDSTPQAVLRMKLEDANTAPAVSGLDKLAGIVNYFIGNDPDKWHTEIPTFGRVQYEEVYPGIDLVYYGNQRELEYDFMVAPGRDARAISLAFDGADRVEVDRSGDLLLHVGESVLRQAKPVVYQDVDGQRKAVESGYVLKGDGRVGFAVGVYDGSKRLIIDPVLAYSTYLGGSSDDSGNGIAVDSSGNAYVTGVTTSTNFPTANPIQGTKKASEDAFVTKLNASGSALVYSTYLGGNGDDEGLGIAVDSSANAYVTGKTNSTNFPTVNPIQANQATFGGVIDAFVTKLNAAGSALVYSIYLGGSSIDRGNGIAIDSSGSAYITGDTESANFPTHNPIHSMLGGGEDAFVTKLNANGSALIYSTYLGGGDTDSGHAIAIDSSGNAYVTGFAFSGNFPTHNPIQGTSFKRQASLSIASIAPRSIASRAIASSSATLRRSGAASS